MPVINFLSEKVGGLLFVIGLNVIIQLGLLIFNKVKIRHVNSLNNELVGVIFGAISLIYSLLIAFVIIAVWQDYEELNQTIEKESDRLNSLVIHAKVMPDSIKKNIYPALSAYCQDAITKEWGTSNNNISLQSKSAITKLRIFLTSVELKNASGNTLLSVLDEDLSNLSDLRRQRISHTRSHVPQMIWSMIIISTMLIIIFSYFFYVKSILFKRMCLLFLGIMIGICLYLIYKLDHPFSGDIQTKKIPYKTTISLIQTFER